MDVLAGTFYQKFFQIVFLQSAAIEGKSQNYVVIIFDCLIPYYSLL